MTLIELMDRVVPLEDEEVSAEFMKFFNDEVSMSIQDTLYRVGQRWKDHSSSSDRRGQKAVETSASHCLVAIGRKPLTENIGLENTRAVVDRGFVVTDEFQRTGEPGVYAIGDIVANSPLLAHAATLRGS